MSEPKIYGPCNPSVLRQLARIEANRRRGELANAIIHGLLAAVFAIVAGVIAFTMAFAAPI